MLPLSFPRTFIAAAALVVAPAAFAAQQSAAPAGFPDVKVGLEKCGPTVLAAHPGDILQAVLKTERGEAVWEIEVETRDGKLFDIECSGVTGKIVEVESRHASADAPEFKAKAKISEEKAREIVLAKHPGKIERVEYEIEADGRAVYEFDIKPAQGHDWRVEVDAASGEISEAHPEWLEIGRL